MDGFATARVRVLATTVAILVIAGLAGGARVAATGRAAAQPGSSPALPHRSPARTGPIPRLVFVPEMETVDASLTTLNPSPPHDEIERFKEAWKQAAPTIEPLVTGKTLAYLSRYAQTETAAVQPPAGWASGAPVRPTSASADGRYVLFSYEPEAGLVSLPSDRPLVQRRLIVAAKYDTTQGTIDSVFVTIRGWAEE